jgi:hypothetical protein
MFSVILLLATGFVPDDWTTFEPPSRIFRVALPTKPTSTTNRSVNGPTGQTQLTTAQVKTADGVYSVQVTESPAKVNPKTLDDGIRQFAASRKATLGPLKTVNVGDNPGREFEMTEAQKRSRVRFVASGNSLIILTAAGITGASVPADADKFLRSLEIGPPTMAVAAAPKVDTATAEKAKAKAEAELARVKAEAELAKIKAEAEIAKARTKPMPKPKEAFSDTPDASVMVEDAKRTEDDSKDAAKTPEKKSNAPVKVTISRIPKGAKPYADETIEDLSKSFPRERDGFRDVGPEGSVLVGVRVTFIERFGGPKVRSAQPIYRSGKSHYAGLIHGEQVGPVAVVVARPGYAIGGLVTHTGLTVDGFGIVFMKIDGDHLDPTDSYNSPWIGDRKGGSPGEVMSSGGLPVGLQGRARNELNAIGLTLLK